LQDEGAGFYVLGGGSNVLIADGAIETPVLLTTGVSGADAADCGDCVLVHCLPGTSVKGVLSMAVKNGWGGLEFAAGIPGTVGGALAGNSGTSAGSMSSVVEAVRTVEENGAVREWKEGSIGWGYRSCSLFNEGRRVALGVTFRLVQSDRASVVQAVKSAMKGRGYQPSASRTAGCVFKNPEGDSAGRLLDESGCKGLSVGGARVSYAHANFIESMADCTASDIMELAAMCRARVRDAFGVFLAFEIKTLGLADS
jgi:UDP-N-acetylmuramate dehydrogenase